MSDINLVVIRSLFFSSLLKGLYFSSLPYRVILSITSPSFRRSIYKCGSIRRSLSLFTMAYFLLSLSLSLMHPTSRIITLLSKLAFSRDYTSRGIDLTRLLSRLISEILSFISFSERLVLIFSIIIFI